MSIHAVFSFKHWHACRYYIINWYAKVQVQVDFYPMPEWSLMYWVQKMAFQWDKIISLWDLELNSAHMDAKYKRGNLAWYLTV